MVVEAFLGGLKIVALAKLIIFLFLHLNIKTLIRQFMLLLAQMVNVEVVQRLIPMSS